MATSYEPERLLPGGVKTKHERAPHRMFDAVHPQTGNIGAVKVDRHAPEGLDEFRALGFLIVDDYKTPEKKAWLDQEIAKRRRANEASETADILSSPRGRQAIMQATIAKDAAQRVLDDHAAAQVDEHAAAKAPAKAPAKDPPPKDGK